MARLATNRDTHLTRDEIAATALRQFDERDTEPTIRSIAADVHVAPTAIYHHFASQAAVYQAVVELVWDEATLGLLELVPDPFNAAPADVLVATGVATRRAWLIHHRASRYMAATPEANEFVNNTVGIMANLFERLGLEGEDAAIAFHAYSSFMIGAVLFTANRKTANAELGDAWIPEFQTPDQPEPGHWSSDQTRAAFDTVMGLSVADPDRDEALFAQSLRRMINSFTDARTCADA
ncbi:MAG: regulatory protein TetR [Marmoricola sp.]|nr:regulatory protein TetR [Marmoricola sp.]